jgi:CheY-like chemotaxis protein
MCYDRDIFIFSPNLSADLFSEFKKHFHEYFAYEPAAQTRVLSFYDTDNNGLGLLELAEAKLEKRKIAEKAGTEKRKIETKTRQREDFLELCLDTSLIETLNQRRQARTRLEILVVEDDVFSQKLISTALNGYAVTFVEDGHTAIKKYLQKAPDIVFLDIELPDVNGHDILAKILSFDKRAHVVMLSGNSQSENVRDAISKGAKSFIAKPFTRERLLQHILKCSEYRLEKTGDKSWK